MIQPVQPEITVCREHSGEPHPEYDGRMKDEVAHPIRGRADDKRRGGARCPPE
jgi:hypothetical protein